MKGLSLRTWPFLFVKNTSPFMKINLQEVIIMRTERFEKIAEVAAKVIGIAIPILAL